ncbi:Docking protein 2 [Pteropus alecto]|uniref:Docking protein 2 n=1 Tax=Pteropus alecto TaxID=9402 RepID=L5L848_PTEAL|nr:Docking protein 2 [Pteropus alecto]
MEDMVVKQGFLYLQQQQTFGKKWRRFGAVLYKQSGCALARLELHEGPEKSRRGEAARRVIRLSDCLRVAEASGEISGPRDTSTFFVETKERLYLLAAPTVELGDWLQAICLLAFPDQRKELLGSEGKGSRPCMEENELYSSTTVTFSFEAGRRCVSGEGSFEFETRQGNEIFSALGEAISAQKNSMPPGPQTQPATVPTVLPRPDSPYSRPHDSLPPPSPTASVPTPRPRGLEGEYAVPFDAVARNLEKSLRDILAVSPQPPVDPLYDSIEEKLPSRPDHIYDEPEGVAALSLYDCPQEPRGEAWKRQAAADRESSGLQHLYPSGQDFPASGWPQGTEYDNVVLKKGPK